MLSPRYWLERYPHQLRLFVALLTVLSFVAPTWHVCSLGGHAMSMADANTHEMPSHDAMKARTFQRSPSGALICFCAPRAQHTKTSAPSKFALDGRMVHDASCLALLLSAMPALAMSSSLNTFIARVSFPPWFPAHREFPVRELIRTFSGRGPPR